MSVEAQNAVRDLKTTRGKNLTGVKKAVVPAEENDEDEGTFSDCEWLTSTCTDSGNRRGRE
jgi:hypothetical protein